MVLGAQTVVESKEFARFVHTSLVVTLRWASHFVNFDEHSNAWRTVSDFLKANEVFVLGSTDSTAEDRHTRLLDLLSKNHAPETRSGKPTGTGVMHIMKSCEKSVLEQKTSDLLE